MNRKISLLLWILSGFAIFAVPTIHAQYAYQPFIYEGKTWKMDSGSMYLMQGDTVICGETMKKIHLVEVVGKQYIGAVKEENHQVYIVYAGQNVAKLLYDFNALSPSVIMYEETYGARIEYKGLILLNSISRQFQDGSKWFSKDGESIPSKVSHIEGIGSVVGMDPFQYQRWNKSEVLACYEDGACIYYYGDFFVFYEVEPTYVSLLKHRRSWNSHNIMTDKGIIQTVMGDTIIYDNEIRYYGHLYRKVYCTDKQKYGDTDMHYYGAMREEGKKVYLIPDGKGKDDRELVFDFGLKIGEQAEVAGNTVKVVEADSIVSEGRKYHRLTLHQIERGKDTGRTCHWTEGIGSECGLLQPLPWDDANKQQLVVSENATTIYDLSTIALDIVNPQRHTTGATSNTIYDLQGRRLTAPPSKGVYVSGGRKYVVK